MPANRHPRGIQANSPGADARLKKHQSKLCVNN